MDAELLKSIKLAHARDQRQNVTPRDETTLPISFEAITDDWLTCVLCKGTAGAEVMEHRLGPVDTGSSNRRIVYIDYNGAGKAAGLPVALFCKATHDLLNRIMLGLSGGAAGEALFYNQIRPYLNVEAPRSFFARYDSASFNSLIMLGDLSGLVIEFCDDRTVMTFERASSQVSLLAKLHGECYRNPSLRASLCELPTWPEFFGRTLAMGMKDGSNRGFLAAESVIPRRLFLRHEEVWAATIASVEQHDHLPRTLAHGDVHLKNWYVAANGEMGLGDWQCCGRGHWGRDFAYTVSTALTVDDRRAWEVDLLRLYLDRLHAAGGPAVQFNEGWLHYRQQLLSSLTWWTITLTPAPGMPDMQPRGTTLEFIKRIATAIDDLDSMKSFQARIFEDGV